VNIVNFIQIASVAANVIVPAKDKYNEADRILTVNQAPERNVRTASRAALIAIALFSSGCSSLSDVPGYEKLFGNDNPVLAGDPTAQAGVEYEIAVQGLGVGESPEETAENVRMLEIVKSQARVYKLQDKSPPSVALLKRRAAADVNLVERALKSEGYYEGTAVITVDDVAKEIPGSDAANDAEARANTIGDNDEDRPVFADLADPDTPPIVNILIRKGPRYSLAQQSVIIEPAVASDVEERVQEAAAKNVGGPAQGRVVVDAEQAALGQLNRVGRPYAKKGKRKAEANFDFDTLDVVTTLDAGPFTVYGDTEIVGLREVEEAYIRDFITWEKGDPISRGTLRDAQRALSGTQLFDSLTVEIPSSPPEDHPEGEPFVAPILITAEEGKHRTISGGLSFSTSDGAGVIGKWEHRNLFGQNEQLTLEADIDQQRQSGGISYVKPRFGKPKRDLIGELEVFHEEDEAFDLLGATGGIRIEEQFTNHLKGSIGFGLEASQTRLNSGTFDSYLFGLPLTLAYDDTDDLLDPTEGVRASAAVAPWAGLFDEQEAGFVIVDLNGSTYIPFDRKRNYVLAVRGRTAAVFAEASDRVPANRRLFSGGGGSVRAFENRFVGPLDDEDDPIGGLSAAELTAELRLRYGSFGVVPFIDAGVVSEELFSEYDDIRFGAGLGLRYFSPVGPIRLDVAIPINRRDPDRSFQFYIGIGQAF